MLLHPPRARTRRPRGDQGAATLEATGMWGLGALVATVVVVALLAGAPGIGDTVRRAICIIVSLGQGSCEPGTTTAQQHVPTDPCVTRADGRDSEINGSFTFVSASTGEHWLVERLSDGTYRVTRGTGGSVGVTAGVGYSAQVTVDDKAYGGAATANASADVNFQKGEVYYAQDRGEVDDLVRRHVEDVAKDNTIGDSGPIRWVVDGVEGLLPGDGGTLPTPDATYVEAGVSAGADAAATYLVANGHVGVSGTKLLGVKINKDHSSTTYLATTLTGEIAAGTWAGQDDGSTAYSVAKAGGEVKTVVELVRDKNGTVTAVRTRTAVSHEASAQTSGSGPESKGYTESVSTLPLRTDADRAIAKRFLLAVGVQEATGLESGATLTGTLGGPYGAAFAEAARARGFVTEQEFDSDSSSNGADLGLGALAKFGGGGSIDFNTLTSQGGRYWDGAAWQTWAACG